MVKERINEIVDFAQSESPYNSANKGWLNDFTYFQLRSSREDSNIKGDEVASVSVHWNKFLATIFFGLAFLPTILLLALYALMSN